MSGWAGPGFTTDSDGKLGAVSSAGLKTGGRGACGLTKTGEDFGASEVLSDAPFFGGLDGRDGGTGSDAGRSVVSAGTGGAAPGGTDEGGAAPGGADEGGGIDDGEPVGSPVGSSGAAVSDVSLAPLPWDDALASDTDMLAKTNIRTNRDRANMQDTIGLIQIR